MVRKQVEPNQVVQVIPRLQLLRKESQAVLELQQGFRDIEVVVEVEQLHQVHQAQRVETEVQVHQIQ